MFTTKIIESAFVRVKIKWPQKRVGHIDPLSPSGDKHLISPYNIFARSNVQEMGTKEIIAKDKMACV